MTSVPKVCTVDWFEDDVAPEPMQAPSASPANENTMLAPHEEVRFIDNEHNYQVIARLNGLSADEVMVSLQLGLMTIEGEQQLCPSDDREALVAAFHHHIRLPDDTDTRNPVAEFGDKNLQITLPRRLH